MKYIVDFHIHSHYSRATSKSLCPEFLDHWARLKGIDVVSTGDCIHPGYYRELKEKLEPAGNGLFRLKKSYKLSSEQTGLFPLLDNKETYFILTTEISSIYKKNGKVRKIHNVCVFPDFASLEKAQARLGAIGNISSDGRPILGLDSKNLLEIILESGEQSYLIPAHIWTPWFSLLGSKSGFDSIEECFEDLSEHIFAVETGLSSDPAMNRMCSFLDKVRLVSNSDAHSPEKLGREANLFDTVLSYQGIYEALKNDKGFVGTIEFFPQEGKYHYDGHRKCQVCLNPMQTLQNNSLCPVCKKPLTKGVMYRVAELSNRDLTEKSFGKQIYYSITPLAEVLAEIFIKKSVTSKSVQEKYFELLKNLGSEFNILLFAGLKDIERVGGELIGEGIKRLREGKVFIEEGYDGEFGRIKVFKKEEIENFKTGAFFSAPTEAKQSVEFSIKEFQELNKTQPKTVETCDSSSLQPNKRHETQEQLAAIKFDKGVCMVLAGPGAGKTHVLTERIACLLSEKNVDPKSVLAITFSNKAAQEMRERVYKKTKQGEMFIDTFHAFGLSILNSYKQEFGRKQGFSILGDKEKEKIILKIVSGNKKDAANLKYFIEQYKQGICVETSNLGVSTISHDEKQKFLFDRYNEALKKLNAFDIDDLIYLPALFLKKRSDVQIMYHMKYQWIFVDEFQDINFRQYELLRFIAGDANPNLFVIGDKDQSIYGFRGSDVRFMDVLKMDYPQIKVIKFTKSYRCPEKVLEFAGQVLDKSEFLSGTKDETITTIHECPTDASEADFIASQIEQLIGGVRSFSMDSGISDGQQFEGIESFSDIAILCRTSAMFDPLERALKNHGIAYQVIGQDAFYLEEPYFSVIENFKNIFFGMEAEGADVFKSKVQKFVEEKKDIYLILAFFADIKGLSKDEKKRLEKLAKKYGHDYVGFFQDLVLSKGVDYLDKKAEAVSVLTMHASKGLEFNAVFIPGCEKGMMPFELFGAKESHELKEEERLFYVAITRTKKYLFLTYAKKRFFKGRVLEQSRSPLLDRVEQGLFDFSIQEISKKSSQAPEQFVLF